MKARYEAALLRLGECRLDLMDALALAQLAQPGSEAEHRALGLLERMHQLEQAIRHEIERKE